MQLQTILLIMLGVSILLTFFAQFKVKSTFKKFSNVRGAYGHKGAQVARFILDKHGLESIKVEHIRGSLTDHYDPRSKTVRLSDDVYNSESLSAVAVAAHEVGHAVQDSESYRFLRFRHFMVPFVNFTSKFTWVLIIAGMLLRMTGLLDLGIIFFSVAVLFQVITLPVELNASKRALVYLTDYGLIATNELAGSKKVLSAAALTYIAAMIYSVIELVRLIVIRNN